MSQRKTVYVCESPQCKQTYTHLGPPLKYPPTHEHENTKKIYLMRPKEQK